MKDKFSRISMRNIDKKNNIYFQSHIFYGDRNLERETKCQFFDFLVKVRNFPNESAGILYRSQHNEHLGGKLGCFAGGYENLHKGAILDFPLECRSVNLVILFSIWY